jgi:hypothetical protein
MNARGWKLGGDALWYNLGHPLKVLSDEQAALYVQRELEGT